MHQAPGRIQEVEIARPVPTGVLHRLRQVEAPDPAQIDTPYEGSTRTGVFWLMYSATEPTVRFSEQTKFTVGSKTFELTYLGPGHGNDLIAVVVRPDQVAFVVDAVSAKRLFYRDFPGSNVDHWIDQVRKVNTLDFDIFIGGHGLRLNILLLCLNAVLDFISVRES